MAGMTDHTAGTTGTGQTGARWRNGVGAVLGGLARRLGDTLLPPQCLACRARVEAPGRLCARCWRDVAFIEGAGCAICGYPFGHDQGAGTLCGACLARPPVYDSARAVLRYDDASRALILALKYRDRLEGAASFGAWMARAGADMLAGADLVVPVPLHRWRLFSRRYNQAALLAQGVARAARLKAVLDLLARTRPTPPQVGRSRRARFANVRGAFAVRAAYRSEIRNCRVVLVDDVMTSGATAEACARTLHRAGAARVDVLTLARVVRPV